VKFVQLSKKQEFLLDRTSERLDGRPSRLEGAARAATLRPSLAISLCENAEAFEALTAEWNGLLAGAHHKSAFLKHQWMSTWWQLIGATSASRQLFVLLGRDASGKLAGALPLYRETSGHGPFRRRVLRFLGSQPEAPEHLDVIVQADGAASIAEALVGALVSLRGEYDAIELVDLAEESLLLSTLASWSRAAGYACRTWMWQECPYIATEGSFDKYLMTLTQKHRYKVRLFGKRLAAAHTVTLEVATEPAQVGPALEETFRLHSKRWTLKTDDVSGFDDPAVHAFHRRVAQRLAADDAIRIFLLRCDGRAVAACYCLQYDRRLYFFQPGFDPAFRKLHVGKVLLGRVIEHCFKNGLREFDFLRGTEDYKFDWTEQKRSTFACNIALTPWSRAVHSSRDARRRLDAKRMALRRRIVARIKASPAGARGLAAARRLLRRPKAAPTDE
jgi:CelD/BcsL family acetyltransferase involved in cellulose biosynthesis